MTLSETEYRMLVALLLGNVMGAADPKASKFMALTCEQRAIDVTRTLGHIILEEMLYRDDSFFCDHRKCALRRTREQRGIE